MIAAGQAELGHRSLAVLYGVAWQTWGMGAPRRSSPWWPLAASWFVGALAVVNVFRFPLKQG